VKLTSQIVRLVIKGSRRRFALVMLVALFGGLVELAGVTTIFPFLSLLARPEISHSQPLLRRLYELGRFTNDRSFIFWIGVAAILFFTFANIYIFFKNALVMRFAISHTGSLATRLLRLYLRKPYAYFVENHSAKIAKDILVQSDMVANTVLLSWMTALSESCTLAALVLLVLWVDVATGLCIVLGLGGIVAAAYFTIRRKIYDLGQLSDEANSRRFEYCLETLGAVKEIKATESEEYFCRAFEPHAQSMAAAYTRTNVLQALPTYFVQSVSAGFIIGLALFHIRRGTDLSQIVPLLSLYVVAGYRLLPSLMKFAGAISQVRQHRAVFDNVASLLAESDGLPRTPPSPRRLPLEAGIEFRSVTFRYSKQARPVFDAFDLKIASNEFVALVGSSGAGKSTLVDLLLGLLSPERGLILAGGTPLDASSLPHWRAQVAYVPQSVFLLDGTVAENIAFGVWPERVDSERVRAAAQLARIDDLIEGLPGGYDSEIGERGSKLSGGQRQRLGIARALYRDPEVLILDESTSALDGITEEQIVRTLEGLKGRKTVIVIAHRHSTVRLCDRILLLDEGRIEDSGSYEELASRSSRFTRLMSAPASRAP
jgi:ABC-type multidrug transport system fused ATPase/permease subunit